jgi:hypothetical protein
MLWIILTMSVKCLRKTALVCQQDLDTSTSLVNFDSTDPRTVVGYTKDGYTLDDCTEDDYNDDNDEFELKILWEMVFEEFKYSENPGVALGSCNRGDRRGPKKERVPTSTRIVEIGLLVEGPTHTLKHIEHNLGSPAASPPCEYTITDLGTRR